MTWQRIDENTYLDDSLVTCVEYQLFIDEMREQGEYYQPDHWTSYQFPSGQAREPILGVRYSDAQDFCEWLTKNEINGWKYRLPTQNEGEKFSVKVAGESLIGFWLYENYRFQWIDSVPQDARGIDLNDILGLILTQLKPDDLLADEKINKQIDRAVIRAINRASELGKNGFSVHSFDILREMISIPGKFKETNFDFSLANVINFALENAVGSFTELERLVDEGISDLPSIQKLGNKHYKNYIQNSIHKVSLPVIRILLRTNILGEDYSPQSEEYLDDLIDLITLRERIAGRSPAFEGIRLVKERIR